MKYQISVSVYMLYNEKLYLSNTELEGKLMINHEMILLNVY